MGTFKIDINDAKTKAKGHPSPYEKEIKEFLLPDSWKSIPYFKEKFKRKMLNWIPLFYVKTSEDLKKLHEIISKEKELAIDLEHHYKESYQGFTCLIQMSTRSMDFIIDPFPIWDELKILRDVIVNNN